VWSLAGPIILSNLSVPLVGAVDTAVVGHLPDPAYIGAVALGSVIFSFIYWGFGFLRMGTTGCVAQAYGAGDFIEARTTFVRALLLAAFLGIGIIALQSPLAMLAFYALDGSPHLEGLAQQYYAIRIWSAPATLANYAVLGCLIGLQKTRIVLILQLVLNGTNVVLDLVFVVGLDWDVGGVAFASLISDYGAAVLGVWVTARVIKLSAAGTRLNRLLDPIRLRAMIQVNGNIFLRSLCLIFAFFYFTAMGTKLGEITLAANAVLMQLQNFLAYGLDGFAHAAEALAGSACGTRDRTAFRAAVKTSTLWAGAVALLFAITYAILGTTIIALITGIPEVRAAAGEYLPWVVVSPLLSVWSFQLDGIFIGATRTAEMRNGMFLALAVYIAATILLIPLWGNHGLWFSLMVLMVARAATLGAWYPRIERALR
jgi:MATE family multidrug resistance protein